MRARVTDNLGQPASPRSGRQDHHGETKEFALLRKRQCRQGLGQEKSLAPCRLVRKHCVHSFDGSFATSQLALAEDRGSQFPMIMIMMRMLPLWEAIDYA